MYVICPKVGIPGVVPPLQANLPHSDEHGSVEADLVAHVLHDHALYCNDNASVYFLIEEAMHGTSDTMLIKLFQHGKDGCGLPAALTSQYAGQDKWRQK